MATYLSPGFNASDPIPQGTAVIDWPFWNKSDQNTIVLSQELWFRADQYRKPVLDEPIDMTFVQLEDNGISVPNLAEAICVGDTKPQSVGNGYVSVTREWATVPQSRLVPIKGYGYTYPGISRDGEVVEYLASEFTFSPYVNSGKATTRFTLNSGSHAFQVGDRVTNVYGAVLGDYTYSFTITAVGSNWWEIERYIYSISAVRGAAKNKLPRSHVVTAFDQLEYYVTDDYSTIPLVASLDVLDSNGDVTNSIDDTTNPTLAQWTARADAGEYFVPEYSAIEDWKGNIRIRRTKLIPYINL